MDWNDVGYIGEGNIPLASSIDRYGRHSKRYLLGVLRYLDVVLLSELDSTKSRKLHEITTDENIAGTAELVILVIAVEARMLCQSLEEPLPCGAEVD